MITNDKPTYDAYGYYKASHSKFTKDTSKDGVRNFASGTLDDFLRFQLKHSNFCIYVRNRFEDIEITWFNDDDEEIANIVYNGVNLKILSMPDCTDRELEMLEDLLRLIYKYEIGYQKE